VIKYEREIIFVVSVLHRNAGMYQKRPFNGKVITDLNWTQGTWF